MKNLILFLVLFCAFFAASSLKAQDKIEIKSVQDMIQLNLEQDGKLYSKTYENWNEINEDQRLQKFTEHFIEECTGLKLENGFNIDLSEGIKIKSRGIDITIKNSKRIVSDSNLNISIRTNK